MRRSRLTFGLSGVSLLAVLTLGAFGCERDSSSPPVPAALPARPEAPPIFPEPAIAPPLPLVTLKLAARAIASDPSNWKTNSKELASFVECSTQLGWNDSPEVLQFKTAVLDMIVFSTAWIDRMDKNDRQALDETLAKLTGSVTISGRPGVSVAGGLDTKNAATALEETVQKAAVLTDDQARQFGQLYGNLLKSFETLLVRIMKAEMG